MPKDRPLREAATPVPPRDPRRDVRAPRPERTERRRAAGSRRSGPLEPPPTQLPLLQPNTSTGHQLEQRPGTASTKFYLRPSTALLDDDKEDALVNPQTPPPTLPRIGSRANVAAASLLSLAPPAFGFLEMDEMEDGDELSALPSAIDLIDDDLLRLILLACPASTLREVKGVNQRTHAIAAALLRDTRRFPRVHKGQGVRRAAHRALPARWSHPIERGAMQWAAVERGGDAAEAAFTESACELAGGDGDGSNGDGVDGEYLPPALAALSDDRSIFHRPPTSDGWSTSLVDRWVRKDTLTLCLEFERLGGPACVGVVG